MGGQRYPGLPGRGATYLRRSQQTRGRSRKHAGLWSLPDGRADGGDGGLRTGEIWRGSRRKRLSADCGLLQPPPAEANPARSPPEGETPPPEGETGPPAEATRRLLKCPQVSQFPGKFRLNSIKVCLSCEDDVTFEERVDTGSAPVIPRARSTQRCDMPPSPPHKRSNRHSLIDEAPLPRGLRHV